MLTGLNIAWYMDPSVSRETMCPISRTNHYQRLLQPGKGPWVFGVAGEGIESKQTHAG